MISVLILTLNEEINLPACLAALAWSNDILVVDSFSTDRTTAIASEHGARVLHRRFDDFANQRNFGLRHGDLHNDWVLHVDADEIVSPELRDEMLRVIATNDLDAYRLASKMMFRDRWLRHAGMYPTYQVRLAHRDRMSFRQVGHGQRENLPVERIGTLRHPLLHYSLSKGIASWVEKHNRYSTDEAKHAITSRAQGPTLRLCALLDRDPVVRRREAKKMAARLPCRVSLRFFYMYFLRLGFLDGSAGFDYCRMLAMYELMIDLKIKEMEFGRADT